MMIITAIDARRISETSKDNLTLEQYAIAILETKISCEVVVAATNSRRDANIVIGEKEFPLIANDSVREAVLSQMIGYGYQGYISIVSESPLTVGFVVFW